MEPTKETRTAQGERREIRSIEEEICQEGGSD